MLLIWRTATHITQLELRKIEELYYAEAPILGAHTQNPTESNMAELIFSHRDSQFCPTCLRIVHIITSIRLIPEFLSFLQFISMRSHLAYSLKDQIHILFVAQELRLTDAQGFCLMYAFRFRAVRFSIVYLA